MLLPILTVVSTFILMFLFYYFNLIRKELKKDNTKKKKRTSTEVRYFEHYYGIDFNKLSDKEFKVFLYVVSLVSCFVFSVVILTITIVDSFILQLLFGTVVLLFLMWLCYHAIGLIYKGKVKKK